ncbi:MULTISPECIES: alpha/beta hydrolase [Prochlorococcus]|uniref:alpha/beta hydrolase n=1 Tax=Prochlorococcus TaxID=1218 RepID=UPI000533AA5C|nr:MULTISPECIES: esterase [Prochlorococcus]KGG13096.1 Phospholipase/carboxylesterase family protein [Prochlorococcus sp. MIT 0601]
MPKDFICLQCDNPTHRLILLHGWGADAEDLIPLGENLLGKSGTRLELVFLRAPQPVINSVGRQWYQLFPADWSAVPQAVDHLKLRLKELPLEEIPIHRTFLLGFSQGGAMALATGIDLPMAGLILCSAYPHPGWHPIGQRSPIFLTHGVNDEVVPIEASRKIIELLKTNELESDLYEFQGGHEINEEIIIQISLFIEKHIH